MDEKAFCLSTCVSDNWAAGMCWTPAGLCHFLSVYLAAYPPQDYREKKRAMAGAPFPSHTPFPHFLQFTHNKILTKSLIHLQMCSRLPMFPVEEREREGRGSDGKAERRGCRVRRG